MKTRNLIALIISPMLIVSLTANTLDIDKTANPPTQEEKTATAVAKALAEAKVYSNYTVPNYQVDASISEDDFHSNSQDVLRLMEMAIDQTDNPRYEELPRGIYNALTKSDFFDLYEVDFNMRPYFQRGDFNKDGKFDIALLIISKFNNERALLMMENDGFDFKIIGGEKNLTSLTE